MVLIPVLCPHCQADILVYTPEEFDRMGEVGLGWVVRQEGVTLYERPSC